ncbi:unnamed protein product [Auanema sp. JU1783]|nr:unnamed protein product [Auanema sp. JU1783]
MSSGVEKNFHAISEAAPSIEYISGTVQQNESLVRARRMRKQAEALQSSLNFGSMEELAIYNQMECSINEVIKVLLLFEENYESSRKEKRLESDWKYMANVLDRVCLLLYFILFLSISLALILFPK